jgi:hypothetical protein
MGTAAEPNAGDASGGGNQARCAAVADSVRASTNSADLPIAVPRWRPAIPIPRSGPTGEVRTTFLVDPMGKAVGGTIVSTGATDPEFRRAMEELILRTPFRPPVVSGCPSWGLGDFRVRSELRVR